MDYREMYRQKVISVDEALRLVRSGQTVTFSSGVAGPLSILRRFHEVAAWADGIRVLTSSSQEDYPYLSTRRIGAYLRPMWCFPALATGRRTPAGPPATCRHI